jgi:hypothetical protein
MINPHGLLFVLIILVALGTIISHKYLADLCGEQKKEIKKLKKMLPQSCGERAE